MKTLLLLLALCAAPLRGLAQNAYPVLTADSTEAGRLMQALAYEQAQKVLNRELAAARRRRRPTDGIERKLREAARGLQLLAGTDRVVVVDSVVVDKAALLTAYGHSPEAGSIGTDDNGATTSFLTERGNLRYAAVPSADSTARLTLCVEEKAGTQFSAPRPLEGLGVDGDANYPFLMPDGATLYFAARTEGGLGNYDLYATRYDSESGRFYKAENMGFPYNSYANDYLLVIDEANGVGWFASDRYQPAGRVCVYTFIPNAGRRTVDAAATDRDALRRLASLRPVSATWTEENLAERTAARRRAAAAKTGSKRGGGEFELVIDDSRTYTTQSDFRSEDARRLCREWADRKKGLALLEEQLDRQRDEYAAAGSRRRSEMRRQVLDLERRVEQLRAEVRAAEKAARNAELAPARR